ncbi:MAG: hypothetical protein RBT42_09205 [Aquabacterium sp.]|jgi:hypothetical protein|uniref:hypothetical protein n=1 Tax=Aquabacterium sp. TaxID=1872578 RepID=UPI002A35C6D6|nr:hypothetical protein [Aquabacterium sp.]MDX9843920.1 hypothetical protein [Aquabacterium sp.]
MKIIKPTVITDAKLVSSSIPENDHPVWSAATAYAKGDRVILVSTHSIYQRLVAGTTAASPDVDPENWQRVGPTNRWAMFDRAVGSLSSATDTMTVTLEPGIVRALALVDVAAAEAIVTMTDGAETVYSRTVDMRDESNVIDWESYFFGDFLVRKTVMTLTDLPPYLNGQVTITLNGTGPVSIGTVAVGSIFNLGVTVHGMSLGIIDYSVKSTDSFGVTAVVERAWAKRMTAQVVLDTTRVDEVHRQLAATRATPAVWIGGDRIDQSVIYGFFKDWSIDVAYASKSYCSLTIEGLT